MVARHALAASSVIGALVLTNPAAPLAAAPRGCGHRDALANCASAGCARRVSALDGPDLVRSHDGRRAPALVHLQAALRFYAEEKYEQALARFSSAATAQSPLRAHADLLCRCVRIASAPIRGGETPICRAEIYERFRRRSCRARGGRSCARAARLRRRSENLRGHPRRSGR